VDNERVISSAAAGTESIMQAEAYTLMEDLSGTYWWYCARREFILDVTSRFVPTGSRIIDYGCGNGDIARELQQTGYDIVAADIARNLSLPVVSPDFIPSTFARILCSKGKRTAFCLPMYSNILTMMWES
jgi:SAM-dependent methyltransferase